MEHGILLLRQFEMYFYTDYVKITQFVSHQLQGLSFIYLYTKGDSRVFR